MNNIAKNANYSSYDEYDSEESSESDKNFCYRDGDSRYYPTSTQSRPYSVHTGHAEHFEHQRIRPMFECPLKQVCNASFRRRDNRARHMATQHLMMINSDSSLRPASGEEIERYRGRSNKNKRSGSNEWTSEVEVYHTRTGNLSNLRKNYGADEQSFNQSEGNDAQIGLGIGTKRIKLTEESVGDENRSEFSFGDDVVDIDLLLEDDGAGVGQNSIEMSEEIRASERLGEEFVPVFLSENLGERTSDIYFEPPKKIINNRSKSSTITHEADHVPLTHYSFEDIKQCLVHMKLI